MCKGTTMILLCWIYSVFTHSILEEVSPIMIDDMKAVISIHGGMFADPLWISESMDDQVLCAKWLLVYMYIFQILTIKKKKSSCIEATVTRKKVSTFWVWGPFFLLQIVVIDSTLIQRANCLVCNGYIKVVVIMKSEAAFKYFTLLSLSQFSENKGIYSTI